MLIVPSRYAELNIVIIWTRECLNEYAACYGIKAENLKAIANLKMDWSDKTGNMSAMAKTMGLC